MNACLGSWKCGKSRAFPTFPQPLLLFFEYEFPEKFTIGRGEGSASALHPPVKVLSKRLYTRNLTLPFELQEVSMETVGINTLKKNLIVFFKKVEKGESIGRTTNNSFYRRCFNSRHRRLGSLDRFLKPWKNFYHYNCFPNSTSIFSFPKNQSMIAQIPNSRLPIKNTPFPVQE